MSQCRTTLVRGKVVDTSDLLEQDACEVYKWASEMVSCPKNLVGYSLIIKEKVGGGKRSPFSSFFFFFLIIYLFLPVLGLRCFPWSFLQLWRVGAALCCGVRPSHCRGLLLQSVGSRYKGSVVVAHGPCVGPGPYGLPIVVAHGLSCSTAYEIVLGRWSNLCPLNWQADS